mgnify:CR=1 FL=1
MPKEKVPFPNTPLTVEIRKKGKMDRRKNNLYMHKDDQTLRLFTARHGIKDQRDYSSNRRKGDK